MGPRKKSLPEAPTAVEKPAAAQLRLPPIEKRRKRSKRPILRSSNRGTSASRRFSQSPHETQISKQRYSSPRKVSASTGGHSYYRRGKKIRAVSEAVAVARMQKWCRKVLLQQNFRSKGQFFQRVLKQLQWENQISTVRAHLAKHTLKQFFDHLGSREFSIQSVRERSQMRLYSETAQSHIDTIIAALQALKSLREVIKRQQKEEREAVAVISESWIRSSLYKYLRKMNEDHFLQRLLARQEVIERKDIARRYFKQLIYYHQSCYNDPLMIENGLASRKVPLVISLILFSSDCKLAEIMSDVKKPFGMGPYHPYSVEKLPEDFTTLRILERRFMFSKAERQLLQQEGILEVNEPPPLDPSGFDPDFVFGSVFDYLRPGEFLDKLRQNHPSLQLGIRRTSSLILDRDFHVIGENGLESDERLPPKLIVSPRTIRNHFAQLQQLIRRYGFLNLNEVDGSYEPYSGQGRDFVRADEGDAEELGRERKLVHNHYLLLRPPPSCPLSINPITHAVPLVQEYLALLRCSRTFFQMPSLIVSEGDSVANVLFNPILEASNGNGSGAPSKSSGQRASGGAYAGFKGGDTFGEGTKLEEPQATTLLKYFSSPRAIGTVWKRFVEDSNFLPDPGRPVPAPAAPSKKIQDFSMSGSIVSLESQPSVTRPYEEYSAQDNRTYKHIRMTLGESKVGVEMSLNDFLRPHTDNVGDRPKKISEFRSSGVEEYHRMGNGAGVFCAHTSGSGTSRDFRSSGSPILSPFVADPSKIFSVDLQIEFERLAISENVHRQQLYLRFMLLHESIEVMCKIGAEKKKDFYRKLFDVEL